MNACTLLPAAAEVRRLRAELSEARAQAAALVGALSDHEAEIGLRRALCRQAFDDGREQGRSEGYLAAVADIKDVQHGLVDAVRTASARASRGGEIWLDHAERNGGAEFGGCGKPYRPVPPEVLARARAARRA